MRTLLTSLAFVLVAPAIVLSDEASEIRDKVLKAQAKDPADQKKLRTHTLKATGISKVGTESQVSTFHLAAVWPSQFRATWEFTNGTMKNSVTLCGSNDRGWRLVTGAPPADLPLEALNDFRADAYAVWVATLTTLGDVETKLTPAGKSKVNGDTVVGLKVSRRPWQDITLYFDEKTWLLRKMAYKSRDAGVTMSKEMIYDGHKEIQGLMLPTKETTIFQGKEIYSWSSMEWSFPEKLDAKLFEKP